MTSDDGPIVIQTEEQLTRYKDTFDDGHMQLFRACLRYGLSYVDDSGMLFPLTHLEALERQAEKSGMMLGEYVFDVLVKEVESQSDDVIRLDAEAKKVFRETWQEFKLDACGKGDYDVCWTDDNDNSHRVLVKGRPAK